MSLPEGLSLMVACGSDGHTALVPMWVLAALNADPVKWRGHLALCSRPSWTGGRDLNLGCICGSVQHVAVSFWGELQRKGCHLLKCHS